MVVVQSLPVGRVSAIHLVLHGSVMAITGKSLPSTESLGKVFFGYPRDKQR